MKRCTICKEDKPTTAFNKNKDRADKRQTHCRDCSRIKSKAYYSKNREAHKRDIARRKVIYRNSCHDWIYQYLQENPCIDCGEKDPVVLEFDHVRGKKNNNISYLLSNNPTLKTIKAEVAKCDVRCANCHCRKTAKDFMWWSYKRELGASGDPPFQ